MSFFKLNYFACTGIPAHAAVPLPYRKHTKATQLYAVAADQGIRDFFENRVDNLYDVTLVKMWVFVSELLDQFRTYQVWVSKISRTSV